MGLEVLCCAAMPLVFGAMFGVDALRDWRRGVELRKRRKEGR